MDAVPNLLTMGGIANRWDTSVLAGSATGAAFTITNDDGTPYDMTGLTWEFVVHADPADPNPVITVTTMPSAQGQLTVTTTPTSKVAVSLTHAATATLSPAVYRHALWSDPGQPTALCWVQGSFTVVPVAQP